MQKILETTVAIGGRAEQAAISYLTTHNFSILDRNWRRRECEIDIIAMRNGTVHFVEVKYRSSDGAGSGLEYIGPRKLKQMTYAAQRWVAESRWHGEHTLAALEVSGDSYEITAFIECIY